MSQLTEINMGQNDTCSHGNFIYYLYMRDKTGNPVNLWREREREKRVSKVMYTHTHTWNLFCSVLLSTVRTYHLNNFWFEAVLCLMAECGCEPWQRDWLTHEHCAGTGLHPRVWPEGGGGGGGEGSRLEEQVKSLCGRERRREVGPWDTEMSKTSIDSQHRHIAPHTLSCKCMHIYAQRQQLLQLDKLQVSYESSCMVWG